MERPLGNQQKRVREVGDATSEQSRENHADITRVVLFHIRDK
jgi:hypothetical protein